MNKHMWSGAISLVFAAVLFLGLADTASAQLWDASDGGCADCAWDTASWNDSGSNWDTASWNEPSWDTASWDEPSWDTATWSDDSWDTATWDDSSWDTASWDDPYTTLTDGTEPYSTLTDGYEPYTTLTDGRESYSTLTDGYESYRDTTPSYRSTTIGSGYSSYSPVSWGSYATTRAVSYPSYVNYSSYTPAKPVTTYVSTPKVETKVVYVPKTETKYVEVAKPVVVYRDTPDYHYDTPAAPTCTITATKTGSQTYTLTWYSYGSATSAAITNIGTVNTSGSRTVSSYNATTYVMTVYGKGGSNTCETTVQGGTPNVMVTLNQVPYTGLDLGPMGMAVYFTVLAGSAIAVAYMLFFWRGGIFNRYALAGAARDEDATIVNEYTLPGYGNTHDTIVENEKSGVTHDSMKMVASDGRSQPRIVITRG